MAEASKKGTLPYGWVVKTSKKYPDRVYYFNLATGASTWECPVLDPPKSLEDMGDSDAHHFEKSKKSTETSSLKKNDIDISSMHDKKRSRSASEKLENKIDKKTGSRKRSLDAEEIHVATDGSKSAIPPTAIVTPVILERSESEPSTSLPTKRIKVNFTLKNTAKRPLKNHQSLSELASNTTSVSTGKPKEIQDKENRPSGRSILMCSSSHELDIGLNKDKDIIIPQDKIITITTSESESSELSDLDLPSEIEEPTPLQFIEHTHASMAMHSGVEENSTEDIEMLDVSAELTKIDDLAANGQISENCSYYIVLDTNVLIEDLNHIDEIKDTPVEGCGPPHIFIPWIVIQELDTLKRSAKNSGTGRAAQNAVKYLNSVLKSKHPRFHGQSPQEAEDIAKTYSKCNDDRILECCMSLAEKMPREKVILLTNDKNLVNKALICDIVVHNWKSMMEVLKPDVIIKGKKKKERNKNKITSSNPEDLKETSEMYMKKKLIKERGVCQSELHTIMSEARQLLKDVLDPLFVAEMDKYYEDCWHSFKVKKDVLKDLLSAYERFWRLVFSFLFTTERDKRNFDILREKANRPEGFLGDLEECLCILTAIEDIFCTIKQERPDSEITVEKIQDLRNSCNEIFNKRNNIDDSISQLKCVITAAESDSVLKAFESNWTVINHLCGMVMDFYQLPHNFVYEKPEKLPSEIEFRRLMVNLYPCVEQLKKLMLLIVKMIEVPNPKSNAVFKELHKVLLELVPTLEIQAEIPSSLHFTPKSLEKFCLNPENIERVKYGCKQVENFFSNLDSALHVMSSSKRENQPASMITD